jgi:3,4-dehydroadipyl-CoA semialdehyde dehydrogenase
VRYQYAKKCQDNERFIERFRKSPIMRLKSYVCGKWVEGDGDGTPLIDPVKGTELARASGDGIDAAEVLAHARDTGGPALRAMSYGERGAMLRAIADCLTENRDEYYQIALENSGNTKADAAFDVDGAIYTLKTYARYGKGLGDARWLMESGFDQLAKEPDFQAGHIWTPIHGAAVHINAFNFPAWGMWEKAAVALLSGVPSVEKPATATCLLANRMVEHVIAAKLVPEGALQILCGGGRDLMDAVDGRDAVAFTGSADTALMLRMDPNVIGSAVRFNVEADSLNCSVLGPDVAPDSAEFDLFVKEIGREMTQKAGQKCTAIRRVIVPRDRADAVAEAVKARLEKTVTGDPRNETVRMGPLINKAQQKAAWEGIDSLRTETAIVYGGDKGFQPVDADPEASCFVPATLLQCPKPWQSEAVHELEVFGPVATVMPYDGKDDAFALARAGGGSLVGSVFTGDDDFAAEAAVAMGPAHGRILMVDESVAKLSTGHGNVMPQCVHGGPGRAGNGEELGGLRGLAFYHQRTAVQANLGRLEKLLGPAAEVSL